MDLNSFIGIPVQIQEAGIKPELTSVRPGVAVLKGKKENLHS